MFKITNTSKAPQGVYTSNGLVYVKAGQSKVLDIDGASERRVRKMRHFEVEPVAAEVEPVVAEVLPATREDAIRSAIEGLQPATDFTAGGFPKVDAINERIGPDMDPVTASERDAVWALMG